MSACPHIIQYSLWILSMLFERRTLRVCVHRTGVSSTRCGGKVLSLNRCAQMCQSCAQLVKQVWCHQNSRRLWKGESSYIKKKPQKLQKLAFAKRRGRHQSWWSEVKKRISKKQCPAKLSASVQRDRAPFKVQQARPNKLSSFQESHTVTERKLETGYREETWSK